MSGIIILGVGLLIALAWALKKPQRERTAAEILAYEKRMGELEAEAEMERRGRW